MSLRRALSRCDSVKQKWRVRERREKREEREGWVKHRVYKTMAHRDRGTLAISFLFFWCGDTLWRKLWMGGKTLLLNPVLPPRGRGTTQSPAFAPCHLGFSLCSRFELDRYLSVSPKSLVFLQTITAFHLCIVLLSHWAIENIAIGDIICLDPCNCLLCTHVDFE